MYVQHRILWEARWQFRAPTRFLNNLRRPDLQGGVQLNFTRAAEASPAKPFVKDVRVGVDSATVLTSKKSEMQIKALLSLRKSTSVNLLVLL